MATSWTSHHPSDSSKFGPVTLASPSAILTPNQEHGIATFYSLQTSR
jgi:hypothetical protein